MMRKIPPKKARWINISLLGAAIIMLLIGYAGGLDAFLFIGLALVIAAFTVLLVFFRCPHCGRFLDKNWGDHCQYCGKEL